MEFRAAQPKKQSPIAKLRARWTTPVFTDEDRAKIGIVIRNSQGMVMASIRTRFEIQAQSMNGLRPKKPKTMNL